MPIVANHDTAFIKVKFKFMRFSKCEHLTFVRLAPVAPQLGARFRGVSVWYFCSVSCVNINTTKCKSMVIEELLATLYYFLQQTMLTTSSSSLVVSTNDTLGHDLFKYSPVNQFTFPQFVFVISGSQFRYSSDMFQTWTHELPHNILLVYHYIYTDGSKTPYSKTADIFVLPGQRFHWEHNLTGTLQIEQCFLNLCPVYILKP